MSKRRRSILLDVLTDDALVSVLSWLTFESVARCRNICRRWRNLVNNRTIRGVFTVKVCRDALLVTGV